MCACVHVRVRVDALSAVIVTWQVLPSQFGVPRRPCFCVEDAAALVTKRRQDGKAASAEHATVNPTEFGDSDVTSASALRHAFVSVAHDVIVCVQKCADEWRRIDAGEYDKAAATVEIKDVKKVYDNGKLALNRFSLILNESECFGCARDGRARDGRAGVGR